MTEIVEGWTAQPWTPGAGAGYERPNLRRRKSPAPEPPARKRKKMLKDKAQLRAPPPRRQQGQLGARHRRLPRPQTRQAPPTTSNGPRSPMASTRSPAPADPSAARSRNRLHPSEDTGQHVVGRQPLQERAGGDVDQGVGLPKKERRRQRHGHRREEADQRDRTAKDEGSKILSPSSGISCRTVQAGRRHRRSRRAPRSPSGSRPASPIPRNPSAATTTRTSIAPRTNDSTPTAITSRRSPGSPQAVPKPSTTSGSGRVSGSGRRPLLA